MYTAEPRVPTIDFEVVAEVVVVTAGRREKQDPPHDRPKAPVLVEVGLVDERPPRLVFTCVDPPALRRAGEAARPAQLEQHPATLSCAPPQWGGEALPGRGCRAAHPKAR